MLGNKSYSNLEKELDMFSIVIAVHNEERNISRCLDSVYIQDVNKEIIVVDDFSTDNTVGLIRRDYPEVILIEIGTALQNIKSCTGSPNFGRNAGVKRAKGKYIAFLDADDYWMPGKLSKQLYQMRMWDSPISCTGLDFCGKKIFVDGGVDYIPDGFVKLISRDKSFFPQYSTLVFRKEIYPQMEEFFGLYDMGWKYKLFDNRDCVRINELLLVKNEAKTSKKEIVMEVIHYETNLALAHYAVKYPQYAKVIRRSIKTYWGTLARYFYKKGKYKLARYHFQMSNPSMVNILYYFTSFFPIIARRLTWKIKL